MSHWSILGSALVGAVSAGVASGVTVVVMGLLNSGKKKPPPGKRPPGPGGTGPLKPGAPRPPRPGTGGLRDAGVFREDMGPPPAKQKEADTPPWLAIPIVVSILFSMPFGERAGDRLEDLLDKPATPLDAALRSQERKLRGDAELKRSFAGMGPEEARAHGMLLARKGIARLDDDTIEQRAALLLTLLKAGGERFGAGFYTGTVDPKEVQAVLGKLPPRDMQRWFELSFKSVKAELHQDPPVMISQQEKTTAVKKMVLFLGPVDGPRMIAVLQSPRPPAAEAYWAVMTIYERVPEMEQPYKRILLRLFSGA